MCNVCSLCWLYISTYAIIYLFLCGASSMIPFFVYARSEGYFETAHGLHRLEKYLNLEGFLEKSLKIKSALKSTGKSLKSLEKSLNSTIFCRTKHCW